MPGAGGVPAPDAVSSVVAAPPPRLVRLTLAGKLLASDSSDTIRSFLDVAMPHDWDEATEARVRHDLQALGYQAVLDVQKLADGSGSELRITVQPLRIVRRIYVSGNWPIFEWEILSYMTWRTGYRLPEGTPLIDEIHKQEQELVSFLQRKGYYDASASIVLDWAPETPEQVDVRVRINLNVGFFRLKYSIGTIRAEGFHLLSESQLNNFFSHCCLWLGRTSTERINEDFKLLTEHYQANGYVGAHLYRQEIRPDHARRQVDLDLAIDERRKVLLHFVGRKNVSEKDLREAVTIFRDRYVGPNELDESATNIFRLYQQRGFFNARVNWRWRDRSANPMQVEFIIYEGPQLKVRDIEFLPTEGGPALTFDSGKLMEQIATRRYPRLGFFGFGTGGYASATQLVQDVRRLEEFYRHEGYPLATVNLEVARTRPALESAAALGIETALDAHPDDADLYLRFRITEGRHEQVEKVEISFVGAHTQTEAQVRKVLTLKEGKPYTTEALRADQLLLSNFFNSVGHLNTDPDATTSTWSADHSRVTIRWVITEGELVRFGPIIIRGNFVTRESIISRDLPFHTGDIFDSNKLLEAQQNLLGRGIFTSVSVTTNPGATDELVLEARQKHWSLRRNPMPVLVQVTERYDNKGEIGVFVGVSTDNPLYSTANYLWRNFAGTGIELEARGELGVRVQSLLVRLAEPRLGSPLVRLDLRGFWRNENTYSVGLVNSYGANAELSRLVAATDQQGRRLPPTLRFFTRLEFNFSQIQVPLYRPEGTTNISVDGDRTQSLKLSLGIVLDRRVGFEAPAYRQRNQPVPPNPLMPVAGYLLSAQATGSMCCSFAPFNLEGSFVALAAQAILLRPFGPELAPQEGWPFGMRRFNLKMNLRVNYGIPLFRTSLPVVERYFAGGDSSTRGYDADALRAEEVRAPVGALGGDAGYRVVPLGGSVRILSQIEWEFAITPKLLNWPWVGALFLDTGAVFDGWEKLRWNDVRFSVGVSLLRILTQFGALSLDYAYPLTLPGQDALLQSERWKHEPWYAHFPGRIHFNWGMPISL